MKITPEMIAYARQLKESCGKINPDIAEEIGMSTSNVQRYINGDVKDADPEAYRSLILALGGDPAVVFGTPAPASDQLDRLLAAYDARHEKELERLSLAKQETIDSKHHAICTKDKWINRLSIVIAVLFVLIIALLIWSLKLDSMISDFGMIQYTATP